MGIARTRLRSVSALLGGALLASLPITPASAADPAPAPTVSISNLTTGQSVSGKVEIDALITLPAGVTAQSVEFAYGDRSGDIVAPADVALEPGECIVTCTVSGTVDLAQNTGWDPEDVPAPAVPDGRNGKLTAFVSTSSGLVDAGVAVVVDNHRPTVAAPAGSSQLEGDLAERGNQSVSLSVEVGASPTAPLGTTVSSVALEQPGMPDVEFTRPASGSLWTATVDTSSLSPGTYWVGVVATDSNDVTGSPITALLVVDHGFTLTAPAAAVVGPNWGSFQLTFQYLGQLPCSSMYEQTAVTAEHVDVLVDGRLWNSADLTSAELNDSNATICTLPAAVNNPEPKPLPLGRHTISYVVTDSIGVQETAIQQVTVALPLATTWPNAPMAVVEGTTLHLAPTVSAPDGFSTLKSWSITFNGAQLASGDYPARPSLTLVTPAKQAIKGTLTLATTSDLGITSQNSFQLIGEWQTNTYLWASHSTAARGSSIRLTASTWAQYLGTWSRAGSDDATVHFQWQYPGSKTWFNGGSAFENPGTPGPVVTMTRVWRSMCFRAVWTYYSPGFFLPSTSTPVCISVKA